MNYKAKMGDLRIGFGPLNSINYLARNLGFKGMDDQADISWGQPDPARVSGDQKSTKLRNY